MALLLDLLLQRSHLGEHLIYLGIQAPEADRRGKAKRLLFVLVMRVMITRSSTRDPVSG